MGRMSRLAYNPTTGSTWQIVPAGNDDPPPPKSLFFFTTCDHLYYIPHFCRVCEERESVGTCLFFHLLLHRPSGGWNRKRGGTLITFFLPLWFYALRYLEEEEEDVPSLFIHLGSRLWETKGGAVVIGGKETHNTTSVCPSSSQLNLHELYEGRLLTLFYF